jgi:hypothetical protein
MLRHIVMYKFKPEVTPAQIEQVIEAFSALPRKIETIIGFEAGSNVSKQGLSEGFTHVFVVTFKTATELAAYLVHPAHEAFVQVVKPKREKGWSLIIGWPNSPH